MAYVHQYSYSGSDVKSIVYYPNGVVRRDADQAYLGSTKTSWLLKSLHTMSFSVHEAKGQVRSLGFRGIRGTTSSVRTIAGSMIFLVINDHPLRDLVRNCHQSPWYRKMGWSIDREVIGVGSPYNNIQELNRLATMLPPFNMINFYVNEFGRTRDSSGITTQNGAAAAVSRQFQNTSALAEMIEGIEFIDEGKVTSINDIVTEITFSFIARNYRPLTINPTYYDTEDARLEAEAERILRQTDDLIDIDPSYGRAITFGLEMERELGIQTENEPISIDSQSMTPPVTRDNVFERYPVTIDNIGPAIEEDAAAGRILPPERVNF